MVNHQIHALLIEDDPDDTLLLKDSLADISMGRIKLDCTDRLSRGLIQLSSQKYDVILLDLNLPDSRGLDTLITTLKRFPRIPVVVLSGLADETLTIEAVRRGAQDYLVKGEITGPLVLRVVRYAIERKQVEAVLRASEARYRTLVEATPNGIALADLDGKLLICNQQAAQLHGYPKPEAMLGKYFFDLVDPEYRQLAMVNAQKSISEGKITNAEYVLLRQNGDSFPAEISTALLRDTAGTPVGFIGITRDISDRKRAAVVEKQLAVLKEEFIANVSHELRNPLSRLAKCLKLMHNGRSVDEASYKEYLNQALRDAGCMQGMVDELLDFLLLESGKLALNINSIGLAEVIESSLLSLKEKAQLKNISITATPVGPELMMDVDASRICRVLINLLENAINFSRSGSTVILTAQSMNDQVIINVVDQGSGISDADCAMIFEKNYKVAKANGNNLGRIVSGLYIAREIVEAHGGSISVNSQLGEGSTFTVILPRLHNQ